MAKTKAHLRRGLWPDSRTPMHQSSELTVAARRLAAAAIEELGRLGVTVVLDGTSRARFSSVSIPSRDARLIIETRGDLIEAFLREQVMEGK